MLVTIIIIHVSRRDQVPARYSHVGDRALCCSPATGIISEFLPMLARVRNYATKQTASTSQLVGSATVQLGCCRLTQEMRLGCWQGKQSHHLVGLLQGGLGALQPLHLCTGFLQAGLQAVCMPRQSDSQSAQQSSSHSRPQECCSQQSRSWCVLACIAGPNAMPHACIAGPIAMPQISPERAIGMFTYIRDQSSPCNNASWGCHGYGGLLRAGIT